VNNSSNLKALHSKYRLKPRKFKKNSIKNLIVEAMKIAGQAMSIEEIANKIETMGWKTRTKNPQSVVASVLSSNDALFVRTGKRQYSLNTETVS
jgi:hypothetical protein